MSTKKLISFTIGFFILFFIYHFPEFFSSFVIMATFKIGSLIVAFVLARVQGWKGLGGYGLGLRSKWAADLVGGLLIGVFFFALSFLVSVKLGYEKIINVASIKNFVAQLPMLLLLTAVPSIAEDILTRGYLYAYLCKLMKPHLWIITSSIIYVLNHVSRLNDGLAVLIYLFLLGMVLASAVWITRSLWLAFGIHWGANLAFESTRSFIETKPLVTHEGSTWVLAATWGSLFIMIAFAGLFKRRRALTSVNRKE